MSINRLLTQQLLWQVTANTADDTYGDQVLAPIGQPIPVQGLIQQASSTEYLTDRDTVVTQWKAFLPAGTGITAFDTLSYGGQKFQVTGAPYPAFNPRTKTVSHLELNLTEVT